MYCSDPSLIRALIVTLTPTAGLKQAPSWFVPEIMHKRVETTTIAAPIPLRSPAVCFPLTMRMTETNKKVQMTSLRHTYRSIVYPLTPRMLSGSPVTRLVGVSLATNASGLPKAPNQLMPMASIPPAN